MEEVPRLQVRLVLDVLHVTCGSGSLIDEHAVLRYLNYYYGHAETMWDTRRC